MSIPIVSKMGYSVNKGGYTVYDGVLNNGKEITKVEIDRTSSPRTCKFTFKDGCTYELSAKVEEASGTATVTDITEEWSVPE